MAKQKKKLKKKLLHEYRMVILNEDTFEEKYSLKLSRLNVFVVTAISAITLIICTIVLIAFTPLREYIPGYSSTSLKKKAIELTYKTDSLEQQLSYNKRYYTSIKRVLTGDISIDEFDTDSLKVDINNNITEENLETNKQDSLLREKVAQEDKYNLFNNALDPDGFILFTPVYGKVSQQFNIKSKHFATDISIPKNTPVKAVTDGTVIFAEWTAETGHVMIIEHSQELISVYKHNSSLIKSQGDLVKAGEVICFSGNSGELTTGPHLHFELWSKGYPVDPENFIQFEL